MVTPQLEKQVKVWHMILGLGVSLLLSAFAWGKAWQANESSVLSITEKVGRVETKVEKQETAISDMKSTIDKTSTDIQWMKSWMEKR